MKPNYEYKCPDCERIYVKLIHINSKPTIECRGCGGLAHRVMSGFSIGGPREDTDIELGDKEIAPGTLGEMTKGELRKRLKSGR